MRLNRTVTAQNRDELFRLLAAAPPGSKFELTAAPRSISQNSLMWSLLTAFAQQVEHHGRMYDANVWKAILLKAFGREMQFVPDLDGQSLVAIGYRSSRLTKEEMSNFIEFILSEGAQRGVDFETTRGEARLGNAGHCVALQGAAWQGKARQG